ncbi:MAG: hypothetical protein JNK58_03545 [Phycisphaerae bacterium]|nr:hypothetical protein [Phycisphaerae bacterium]
MPSTRALILATIAFVIVGAVSVYVSYRLAGGVGAGFMAFGVVVASLLSVMGVGFNMYYSKKHSRPPSVSRK